MAYFGEYFYNRDFYSWGLDYEITRLVEAYSSQLEVLRMYRDNYDFVLEGKKQKEAYLSYKERKIVDYFIHNTNSAEIEEFYKAPLEYEQLLSKYEWGSYILNALNNIGKSAQLDLYVSLAKFSINEEELHNRMSFINLYTIVDEFLVEVIRAIGVYYSRFVRNYKVRVNYDDISGITNDTDLRDYIIQTALVEDKNLSGATNKLNAIYRFFEKKNDDIRASLALFQIERNSFIHNQGIYSDRDLSKIQQNLIENYHITLNGKIRLTNDRINDVIKLIENIFVDLQWKVDEFFGFGLGTALSESDV